MSSDRILTVTEIQEMIPHRYPFLLIDRVKDITPNEGATGVKNVTINEPFFQGHFPGHPIMPGVMIVEAMAQTAGVLVVDSLGEAGKGKLVYFMTVDNAKFRKPVTPGDTLDLRVVQTRARGNIYKFEGKAYCGDELKAEAHFSAMIVDK